MEAYSIPCSFALNSLWKPFPSYLQTFFFFFNGSIVIYGVDIPLLT